MRTISRLVAKRDARPARLGLAAAILASSLGLLHCKSSRAGSTDESDTKAELGDRYLAGAGIKYPEHPLRAGMSMKERRDAAWKIVAKVTRQVDIARGVDQATTQKVPVFQTWYSAAEFQQMLTLFYKRLQDPDFEAVRAAAWKASPNDVTLAGVEPFPDSMLEGAFERYVGEVRKGMIPGWSEEDLAEHFQKFETASDDTRIGVHEQIGLTNKGLVVFSPALIEHYLKNYSTIYRRCGLMTPSGFSDPAAPGLSTENFTQCFADEFPANSVAIKTTWAKVEDRDGNPSPLVYFDTSANGLAAALGTVPVSAGGLATEGRGLPTEAGTTAAGPDDIMTVTLRNSDGPVNYRMTGMHIITKELRHWTWVSLWWSPDPTSDFGADRPPEAEGIRGVFRNYKMCVVTDFAETDQDPGGAYRRDPRTETLAASLDASHAASAPYTWCSNPYIEIGHGNVRTNCIGCHQHAGSSVVNAKTFYDACPDPLREGESLRECQDRMTKARVQFPFYGRSLVRQNFPADYLYTFNQPDDNVLGRIRRVITAPSTQWHPPAQ